MKSQHTPFYEALAVPVTPVFAHMPLQNWTHDPTIVSSLAIVHHIWAIDVSPSQVENYISAETLFFKNMTTHLKACHSSIILITLRIMDYSDRLPLTLTQLLNSLDR